MTGRPARRDASAPAQATWNRSNKENAPAVNRRQTAVIRALEA